MKTRKNDSVCMTEQQDLIEMPTNLDVQYIYVYIYNCATILNTWHTLLTLKNVGFSKTWFNFLVIKATMVLYDLVEVNLI